MNKEEDLQLVSKERLRDFKRAETMMINLTKVRTNGLDIIECEHRTRDQRLFCNLWRAFRGDERLQHIGLQEDEKLQHCEGRRCCCFIRRRGFNI